MHDARATAVRAVREARATVVRAVHDAGPTVEERPFKGRVRRSE